MSPEERDQLIKLNDLLCNKQEELFIYRDECINILRDLLGEEIKPNNLLTS